ncbi:IS30 family transposase [Amycolatopsis sp. NPDC051372]|uniref:IS30 family transposase n=1 Tax=Amycolatopsis sp. NPDC051372 TaxID=3155669 RepID=UPI003413B2BE
MVEFEIRANRGPGGGRRLSRERVAYFELMRQGYSRREACRIVGIDQRTGKRWRNGWHSPPNGRKPVPPIRGQVPASDSGRYLREEERIHIAGRLREHAGIRTIARELGRAPSTISREIHRNGMAVRGDTSRWSYRPHSAQRRAEQRRPRPKQAKIQANPELSEFIQRHLNLRWSPEQISQALQACFPGRPEMHVAHETIYQALYVQGRGELRREIARALRTGRTMRKPRRQSQLRRSRFSTPMVMISERPAEADDRAVPGHWEGDLIIGKDNGSAIGTLVERSTRYLLLVHLPHGRSAEQCRDALVSVIGTLPAHLRRSLTWDQGVEMGRHHEFALATNMPVFFCDPASPWQRGSNENTNGLLRQHFPKGTSLIGHSPEDLAAVAAELNARPRKTLDWETPAQRLAKLLAKAS